MMEVLFPYRCPICDRILSGGMVFCPMCAKTLPFMEEPRCKVCGKHMEDDEEALCEDCGKIPHSFIQSRAAFMYTGKVRRSLYRFKYGGRRYARGFALKNGEWIREIRPDVIVPIPLHRKRQRQRGYNQALCLGRELSLALHIPLRDVLVRTRETAPQKRLSRDSRKKNLKNAFQIDKDGVQYIQYEHVLVVDDIYTTGSTLDEAAQVLMSHGAEGIYGAVCAIGTG